MLRDAQRSRDQSSLPSPARDRNIHGIQGSRTGPSAGRGGCWWPASCPLCPAQELQLPACSAARPPSAGTTPPGVRLRPQGTPGRPLPRGALPAAGEVPAVCDVRLRQRARARPREPAREPAAVPLLPRGEGREGAPGVGARSEGSSPAAGCSAGRRGGLLLLLLLLLLLPPPGVCGGAGRGCRGRRRVAAGAQDGL